jgi:hypothetical protein
VIARNRLLGILARSCFREFPRMDFFNGQRSNRSVRVQAVLTIGFRSVGRHPAVSPPSPGNVGFGGDSTRTPSRCLITFDRPTCRCEFGSVGDSVILHQRCICRPGFRCGSGGMEIRVNGLCLRDVSSENRRLRISAYSTERPCRPTTYPPGRRESSHVPPRHSPP